jgi:ribose/xylose/arabinose/galactoside ABC-type transport system permease subunit
MKNLEITNLDKKEKKFEWRDWFVYFILVILIITFTLLSDKFFQFENFASIGRQTAMVSLIAFGGTFVITTGNIDLSVGSIVGLVGVISAMTLRAGFGVIGSSLSGLAAGTLIGLINGLLTAKVGIPAFLVTLGTMQIARGIALTVTNTRAIIIINNTFTRIWGAGAIVGIPTSIFWTCLFFLICFWLYHYTYFGNYVKAVGGNKTAAKYSGINTDKITIMVFVIAGFLASVAGLLMAARLKGGRPEVGGGMELDAVAAVILGGTALAGGKGKMLNTLVGSLIMGVIINGLIILGVQSNIQQIIKGAIIIAAVSLNKKQ